MARPRRKFRPNGLYHVVNRAQAHAPLFETDQDVARMNSLLAWASREGWLQVLAGCLLTTHFHLVVQSVDGSLDTAMQRVEDGYARHYNRTRERTGHVLKGRYFAREIQDEVDLVVTVDYVDWNPVSARMVNRPEEYPHGTARYYMGDVGLPWLARDRLESVACRLAPAARYAPELYPVIWRYAGRANARSVVARCIGRPASGIAGIARLASMGPEGMQAWLQRQLELEEGRQEACLVLPSNAVLSGARRTRVSGPELLRLQAGLLRCVAGLSTVEVGAALGMSQSAASRHAISHRKHMRTEPSYAREVATLVASLVEERYGDLARRLAPPGELQRRAAD